MKNKKKLLVIMASLLILIGVLYVFKNGIGQEEPLESKVADASLNRSGRFTDFKEALELDDDVDEFFAGQGLNLDDLTSSGKPIVLFFSWEDCGPCKLIEPLVYEQYQENPDLVFKYIEVVHQESFARQYPIRVTPSFVFLDEEGKSFGFSKEVEDGLNIASYTNPDTEEWIQVFEGLIPDEQFKQMIEEMNEA